MEWLGAGGVVSSGRPTNGGQLYGRLQQLHVCVWPGTSISHLLSHQFSVIWNSSLAMAELKRVDLKGLLWGLFDLSTDG